MSKTPFQKKWTKALNNRSCKGYYDKKPCRANTVNPEHSYCKAHKKLLKERIDAECFPLAPR